MRWLWIGLSLILGLYSFMLTLHTISVAVRGVPAPVTWVIMRLVMIVCSGLGSYALADWAGLIR
jgi:hypothetical protein